MLEDWKFLGKSTIKISNDVCSHMLCLPDHTTFLKTVKFRSIIYGLSSEIRLLFASQEIIIYCRWG